MGNYLKIIWQLGVIFKRHISSGAALLNLEIKMNSLSFSFFILQIWLIYKILHIFDEYKGKRSLLSDIVQCFCKGMGSYSATCYTVNTQQTFLHFALLANLSKINCNIVASCLSWKSKVSYKIWFFSFITSHVSAVTKMIMRISWWYRANLC